MLDDSVVVLDRPAPSSAEEVGGITIVELLIHPNTEIREMAQKVVRLLLQPK